ncbi:MAG: rRNA maturation RNase YbeY [Flavobacteriaceae bacterium]
MIEFYYEIDFKIDQNQEYRNWVLGICVSESYEAGNLSFIFCADDYLLELNKKYLNHDRYTDIISFDYSEGPTVAGDVFISVERVKENAKLFGTTFEEELRRVMAHGVLHLMGYRDKSEKDIGIMRKKELEKMKLFHVEP